MTVRAELARLTEAEKAKAGRSYPAYPSYSNGMLMPSTKDGAAEMLVKMSYKTRRRSMIEINLKEDLFAILIFITPGVWVGLPRGRNDEF